MMAESTSSNKSTCPVCLRRLKRCRVGKPENCEHLFCFDCIFEWAKNVNTCPVDRIKFNTVHVFTNIGGKCIQKIHISDSSLEEANGGSNDLTYCEVCREHTREDRLLLCDGCDKGYHLECLSPPLSEVPDGDWYCSECEPIIMSQYMATSSSEEESDSCSAVVVNCEYTSSYESLSDSGSSFEPGRNRRAGTQLQILDSSSSESEGVVQQSKGKRVIRLMFSGSSSSSSNEDSDESDDSLVMQSIISKRSRRINVLDVDEEESGCSKSSDLPSNDILQDPCTLSKVLPLTRRNLELSGTCRDSASSVARSQIGSSRKLTCESDDVGTHRRKQRKPRRLTERNDSNVNSHSTAKSATILTSATQKQDPLQANLDDDDDASIHSGYYSNCDENFPNASIQLGLSSNMTSGALDIHSDYVHEDELISQSTTPNEQRRAQQSRTECNGRVLRVAPRESRSATDEKRFKLEVTGNAPKTSKPTTKFTGRKRRRRSRRKRRSAQKGKGKRKRIRRTGRKRRKVRRTAGSDDPRDSTYVPHRGFAPGFRPVRRRLTRARTAATHSPRNCLIRAAAIAAHKEADKAEGLHRAQAVMRQRRESLQNTPFRTSAAAILSLSSNPRPLRNFPTPKSGYSTPQHDVGLPRRHSVTTTPPSAISNGKTAPRRRLSGTTSSPQSHSSKSLPPVADGKWSQGQNLMSDIFQKLDDLHNTNNTIRRDGTIVPVQNGSPPSQSCSSPLDDLDCQDASSLDVQRRASHHQHNSEYVLFTDNQSNYGGVASSTVLNSSLQTPSSGRNSAKQPPTSNGTQRQPTANGTQIQPTATVAQRPPTCTFTSTQKPPTSNDTQRQPTCNSSGAQKLPTPTNVQRPHTSNDGQKPLISNGTQKLPTSTGAQRLSMDAQRPPAYKGSHQELGESSHSLSTVSLAKATEVHHTPSEAESIVKSVLKPFYVYGHITPHEYSRILQRATKKVCQQLGPINLDRVNRLVVEFVQGYQESRRAAI